MEYKTQEEYLLALAEAIKYLNPKDATKVLQYYQTRITTSIEYGEKEEDVIKNLPDIETVAKETYESHGVNYLENVAEGLANLINMYDVEMIVIGGSLSDYGEKFLPKLKTKVANKLYNQYTYDLNMKVTTLKNDAGIIGAALLEQYM